jgi:hypothetical protein
MRRREYEFHREYEFKVRSKSPRTAANTGEQHSREG